MRGRAVFRSRLAESPIAFLIALACAAISPATAAASVEDFYKSKNITLLIGYGPGASYDSYSRLVARHLGSHIPGSPSVVPQNKPGSGSLVATNYLYNVAPKDGSVIATVGQSVYLMQLLERPGIKFDARKLNWIGRMTDVNSLVVSWHKSRAKTIKDLQNVSAPIAVGGTLSGSTLFISFMNKLTGTRFQPIKGYGSAEAVLAMERGEVDGTASITSIQLKAERADWIRNKTVNVLVQVALQKDPAFPDVPLLTDLATNPTDLRIFQALSSTNAIGRAMTAPPGIPADRLAALRAAFDATVRSDKFMAEAKKIKHEMNPMSGADLQKVVLKGGDLTPEMIATMKQVVEIKLPSRKKEKKAKKKDNKK
jgi:tripartite-type tricarboxylate transporter receptor subunit TctC